MEIWKDIKGYEGHYEVSNLGNVKSVKRYKKVLKPRQHKNGYVFVSLCANGKAKDFSVHRLVGNAFLDNPENLPEINHKDEDKTNNNASNLEWCTREYNQSYGTRVERCTQIKLEKYATKVLCVETGRVYPSIRACASELGIVRKSIYSVINGFQEQTHGLHFVRVQND